MDLMEIHEFIKDFVWFIWMMLGVYMLGLFWLKNRFESADKKDKDFYNGIDTLRKEIMFAKRHYNAVMGMWIVLFATTITMELVM